MGILCKYCHGDRLHSKGKTKSGTQRYKCLNCHKSFTMSDNRGRPPAKGVCQVCGGKIHAHGLCKKHYMKEWRENGKIK